MDIICAASLSLHYFLCRWISSRRYTIFHSSYCILLCAWSMPFCCCIQYHDSRTIPHGSDTTMVLVVHDYFIMVLDFLLQRYLCTASHSFRSHFRYPKSQGICCHIRICVWYTAQVTTLFSRYPRRDTR